MTKFITKTYRYTIDNNSSAKVGGGGGETAKSHRSVAPPPRRQQNSFKNAFGQLQPVRDQLDQTKGVKKEFNSRKLMQFLSDHQWQLGKVMLDYT